MKVLALDFDGVMADSQMECLFVGFNSYLKLHKNTRLFGGQKFTFENFNKIKKKCKKTTESYKKLRPYVIDAFCWFVILRIIENGIKIKNQSHYNQIRKRLMKKNYEKYIDYFYNERYSLQKKSLKKWLGLETPFKKIISGIKKLESRYAIAIATNNKMKGIQGFLAKYKIKPKVIADSNISTDKKKQLEHIKNKLNVNFDGIYFVDDQARHFPKVLRLGVHCYLATWGYNAKKQQEEAKSQGVVLLDESNFYDELAKGIAAKRKDDF